MPRYKRNTTRNQESIQSNISTINSINSTLMDSDSKLIDDSHFKFLMWKEEIKDKIKNAYQKLCNMEKEKLQSFDSCFKNGLMAIPRSVLSTPVDIDNKEFKTFFLGNVEENSSINDDSIPIKSPATVKRRSRSVTCTKRKETTLKLRNSRLRSTSVDVYKTPTGKVRLSSIMSNKKYTVTKPKKAQDSAVNVKRIMKPNEEAISTCGSPLYVASCTVGAPHVNIPLPGGVVLNIEAKETRGPLDIPVLDSKTKNQIKLLCEQLNSLV